MYERLGESTLKNGERLDIGVVTGPDAEWLPRLTALLGHKGPDSRAHLRQSLESPLDSLRSRYYVGRIGNKLAGQMMVVGDDRCGILGHVFTLPEHRRKGVCAALMARQMTHCRERGYEALCLGTGFESPPYWIYHSFGFRSVGPGNGCMLSEGAEQAAQSFFASAPCRIMPMCWEHWGWLDLLALQPLQPDEELPRSTVLHLKGQQSAEGPFCSLQFQRQANPDIQANVLVSETGAVVGWALLTPDTRWFGDVWALEVYAHPNYRDQLPALAASLALPSAPVAAYFTEPRGVRADAVAGIGLKPIASLPEWLMVGERRDLTIWSRSG